MLIILDLDNTLLDTGRLKEAISKSLVCFGVPERLFWQIYKKIRKRGFYNHKIYLNYLFKEKPINIEKCAEKLEKLNNQIKNFLYPDTLPFLKGLKKMGARLILLTWGDTGFQKVKIKKAKIKHFFEKIFITETTKLPYLRQIAKNKNEEIYFIDDDPLEVKEVLEKFKNITALQIKRKSHDKEVKDIKLPNLPIFSNLKEVEKWILKHS